jgi:hypothetical protein
MEGHRLWVGKPSAASESLGGRCAHRRSLVAEFRLPPCAGGASTRPGRRTRSEIPTASASIANYSAPIGASSLLYARAYDATNEHVSQYFARAWWRTLSW